MTNVEIYDSSNSQLSSDEYSHEEEDYDALMDAAVSKQRPQKTKSMRSESEKPENGAPESAASTEKGKEPDGAAVPPSTRSETVRRIRQLQLQRVRLPNLYFKRRSIRWLRPNKMEYNSYFDGLKDLVPKRKLKHLIRFNARQRSAYDSRSPSRSRSHSRSLSRSRSRSYSRSRSGSGSPELICLDDTENEESPEKPEAQARVTPIKENISTVAPPQLNYEMPERKKANALGNNENGASILDEFLVKKDPQQPGFDYGKLSACLELEQALKDQSRGELDVAQSLVVDVTLKRRRSVTPPASDEKRKHVEDDDIIEFLPVPQKTTIGAAPPLNLQVTSTPAANPLQHQPAFKLSTPYSVEPPSAAKQAEKSTPESYSLNTPTPTATPMEISYPNEKLSNNMKGNAQTFSIQQAALPQVAASYAAAPQMTALAQRPSSQAAPLLQAPVQQMHFPRSSPPQQLPPASPPQQLPTASSAPPQHLARPRLASPHQLVSPKAVSAQHLAPPQQLGTSRSVPQHQLGIPRSAPPQQVAPPQQPDSSRLASVQPLIPQREAALHQIAPPQQVHQTPSQPGPAPIVAPNFAVPQQPQPRRSDTVSTQTHGLQSPASSSSTTRQKSSIDLNNSDANFHCRIKNLFEEFNSILIDKIDSVRPEKDSLGKEIERLEADVATLDKLMAKKEEEYNRLLHLRCVKKELHYRLKRMERKTLIRDLLPVLLHNSCSADELREMQAMLEEEQDAPMAPKHGVSAFEKCLNLAENNQNNIRILRDIMGLKERAPPLYPCYFDEDQKLFQRDSFPVSHLSMRDQRYDSRDAVNDHHQPERNPDKAPLAKRPKLMHPQDRNLEMSSSLTNLSGTLSDSLNKIRALKKSSCFSNISLENNLDNESLIEPLCNSSPMVSHRQLASRQHYQELHSASSNDQEKVEKRHRSHKNKPHKSTHKSHRESSATANGRTERRCHECNLYEATFMCSNCQNQWYCSRECQVRGWDSHYRTCGI